MLEYRPEARLVQRCTRARVTQIMRNQIELVSRGCAMTREVDDHLVLWLYLRSQLCPLVENVTRGRLLVKKKRDVYARILAQPFLLTLQFRRELFRIRRRKFQIVLRISVLVDSDAQNVGRSLAAK